MSNQMPTAAKIGFLKGAIAARKDCLPRIASHDADVARSTQYQIEVLEAMLEDYKAVLNNLRKAGLDDTPS